MRLGVTFTVLCLLGLGWSKVSYFFDLLRNRDLTCLDSPVCAPVMVKPVDKRCKCQNICFVQRSCMAFSVKASRQNPKDRVCKIFKRPQNFPDDYSQNKYKLIASPETLFGRRSVLKPPNADLKPDGFYYVLTEHLDLPDLFATANLAMGEVRNICRSISSQEMTLELARFKTIFSLRIARQYSVNEEATLIFDTYRRGHEIKIGPWPPTTLNETEICNHQTTCNLFKTGNLMLYELYGLTEGRIDSIGSGSKGSVRYTSKLKYRALCQGNYLGLYL